MSKPTFRISTRALAKKWGTTPSTVRRYAAKGCDWDASDDDVARWLLSQYNIKKSKAMYQATRSVLGMSAQQEAKQPFDTAAVGALLERSNELEERVANLHPGDTGAALALRGLVNRLEADIDRLSMAL